MVTKETSIQISEFIVNLFMFDVSCVSEISTELRTQSIQNSFFVHIYVSVYNVFRLQRSVENGKGKRSYNVDYDKWYNIWFDRCSEVSTLFVVCLFKIHMKCSHNIWLACPNRFIETHSFRILLEYLWKIRWRWEEKWGKYDKWMTVSHLVIIYGLDLLIDLIKEYLSYHSYIFRT